VKISDLKSDERNANRGTAEGAALIRRSLSEYGAGRSILLDKNGAIIAGNKTAEGAAAIGLEDILVVQTTGDRLVAVQRMDLEIGDPRARQLAIADNRASEVSLAWDLDILKQLEAEGAVVLPDFFSADEIADFWPVELLVDEDEVPPAPAVPVTRLGDLYLLGNHRLLCGSATSMPDCRRLLDGLQADALWTDPPYNLAYVGKTAAGLKIENDAMSPAAYEAFIAAAFGNAAWMVKDGGAAYVAHADFAGEIIRRAFRVAGFHLSGCLIWRKNAMVLGRNDYQWRHEPILYGWRKGSAHIWLGGRTQTTILEFDKPERSAEHPTMKPVALIEQMVANSTVAGDAVLDLFAGSGSTLIACEKLRRRGFMMELDARYCDVIVARWEEATGEKAELLNAQAGDGVRT
jgi:DNA modification methylase